ncbi:hypothetical protein Poly59_40350 [Rubripirellula reticaptiva]|uniref:Uncharacterized protein n=1 Tax=Rubripirellula reticaptiva TaxID=2528013 RepID=A0A5C6EM02_9BACT|nr:hypothetical protein Poly59_40350 [Rubripirellula reticaptiva]
MQVLDRVSRTGAVVVALLGRRSVSARHKFPIPKLVLATIFGIEAGTARQVVWGARRQTLEDQTPIVMAFSLRSLAPLLWLLLARYLNALSTIGSIGPNPISNFSRLGIDCGHSPNRCSCNRTAIANFVSRRSMVDQTMAEPQTLNFVDFAMTDQKYLNHWTGVMVKLDRGHKGCDASREFLTFASDPNKNWAARFIVDIVSAKPRRIRLDLSALLLRRSHSDDGL